MKESRESKNPLNSHLVTITTTTDAGGLSLSLKTDSPTNKEEEIEKRSLTLDEALQENPISLFQYRILLMCGLAFMVDALEVNFLFFLSVCAGKTFNLTDTEEASLNGSVFAGILVGAFFWGDFSSRYGRRVAFIAGCGTIAVGGMVTGLAPNYASLIIIRTIVGFGVGGASIPFDLLAEFTPDSLRGRFLVYIEGFWTLGSLFVTGLAWGTLTEYGWRVLAYLTAIPICIATIAGMIYLPESPRWLMLKGRVTEAEKVVRDAAQANGYDMGPFELIPAEGETQEESNNYGDLVKDRQIRSISFPLWTVWTMFGITYYGMILLTDRMYSNTSTDDDDSDTCTFDYSNIFIVATAEVFGIAIAAYAVDAPDLGRVKAQMLFYFLAAIGVVLLGIVSVATPDGGTRNGLIFFFAYLGRTSIMAASTVTWVITPELYPTDVRTLGHAVGNALSKVGAFLVSYMIFSPISNMACAVLLAIFNIVAVLFTSRLPETKGKALGQAETTKINAGTLS